MKIALFCVLFLITGFAAAAQDSDDKALTEHLNLSDDRVALQGYDPVSYFKSDEPKEGNEQVSHTYKGATYYFASDENREQFKNNPRKFMPAYGGWCAYAMGDDGSKVKVDPETYKIIDGELYLFFHNFWNNTLPDWNDNEAALKPKADRNWQQLISKN